MKKKFAIIGNPVSHSLSPILHSYWFDKHKIDAEYTLLNIKEEDIKDVVKKIRDKELYGVNGKYFHKLNKVNSSKESYDKDLAKKVWIKSLEYIK